MKNLFRSRLNLSSIASIIIGIILWASGVGFIGAALAGLFVHVINTFVIIQGNFSLNNDPWMLLLSIIGGVISSVELIVGDNIFPAVNPIVWNGILAVLTIILRQLSTPVPGKA